MENDIPCDRCQEIIKMDEELFHVAVVHHPSKRDPRLIPNSYARVCGGCYLQLRGTVELHREGEE